MKERENHVVGSMYNQEVGHARSQSLPQKAVDSDARPKPELQGTQTRHHCGWQHKKKCSKVELNLLSW